MPDDLTAEFERATTDATRLSVRPDNDTLLKMYALFKQGSAGDAHGEKPGFFDFVGTAKFEAWVKLRGMPQDEAKQKYIALVRQLEAGE